MNAPVGHRRTNFARVCVASACLLLWLSGCQSWRPWRVFSPRAKAEPAVLSADATADEILNALNDNIANVYAWRSTEVKITAKQAGVIVPLSAVMAVESPRKLRLIVNSLAGNEVDLGSNPERFWFWMRRGEPQGVMTASYDDVADGKPLGPLPFQPDWLIEALGVIPIVGADYSMEELPLTTSFPGQGTRRVAFVAEQQTPDGRKVIRRIVVDVRQATILEHSLRETSGRLIARATLSNYQRDADGVRLPHRIDLAWPDSGVELALRLGTVEVNPRNISEQTWAMPSYPDSPVLDLTRFRPAP